MQKAFDAALHGQDGVILEVPVHTKAGGQVCISLKVLTRRSPTAEVVGVVGVGEDVTGWRPEERQAASVANDLTNLIDTANVPIFGITPEGLVNVWNQKAAKVTGFSKAEVCFRPCIYRASVLRFKRE